MDDPRTGVAPVLSAFAEALDARVTGLFVGGSLATGDYRPRISDIDAVALVDGPLRRVDRAAIVSLHERLLDFDESARALHCVYVARRDVLDVDRTHWTWSFGQLFRRRLGGIARAELLADPIVMFGPQPSTWLPAMDGAALRDAARAELSGYWRHAVRRRKIWLQDTYIDLGLTVWARADATIRDGALITKSEAIDRLRARDLPDAVVEGVAARRAGETTELSDADRKARATTVRMFLRREIAQVDLRSHQEGAVQ